MTSTKLLPCPVESRMFFGESENLCATCPNRAPAPTLADLEAAAWHPATELPQGSPRWLMVTCTTGPRRPEWHYWSGPRNFLAYPGIEFWREAVTGPN